MQDEKQFLVGEITAYLERTDYVIFADYTTVTVAEVEDLRRQLSDKGAEFHVIKNRIFKRAAEARGVRNFDSWLSGQTAVIFGGPSIADVIKILEAFEKTKKKLPMKGGIVGKSGASTEQIKELTKLPPIEVLRAQLLGILNSPAQKFVTLLNVPAQQMVTVLGATTQNLFSVLQQRKMKLENPGA